MKKYAVNFSDVEFQLFIEEINKNIFNGEITEIIEVTYAYKKIGENQFFNTTLFTAFGGEVYKKDIDFDILEHKVKTKLLHKISQIDFFQNKISDVYTQSKYDKIRIKFLRKQFDYVKNALEMALYGLPFEIQKAGIKNNISKDKSIKHIQKIRSLEKENFGGRIKIKPKEVEACYKFLLKKQKTLGENKKIEFEYFIQKVRNLLPENFELSKKKIIKKTKLKDIFLTQISREDYCAIFDIIFEIYKLPQRTKVTNVGSIYDGEKYLEIPNKKSYEYKNIKSILKLSLHEIMAHSVNLENTKRRLGNFRGAHNLEKEEGLAVMLEKIFEGYDIQDLGIISSLPTLLIGEICSTRDFKKFLSLSYAEPNKAFLRFKRNYSIYHKGVQHKDTSYSRGILKTMKYVQEKKDFKDLFLGKVSFEELKYLKNINLIDPNKSEIKPLFIAEYLYFSLKNNGENITLEKFLEYMKDKYYFMNTHYLAEEYKKTFIKNKLLKIQNIFNKYFV